MGHGNEVPGPTRDASSGSRRDSCSRPRRGSESRLNPILRYRR
jgi:hypothetical protein